MVIDWSSFGRGLWHLLHSRIVSQIGRTTGAILLLVVLGFVIYVIWKAIQFIVRKPPEE